MYYNMMYTVGYVKNCFFVSFYSFMNLIKDVNKFFDNNKETPSKQNVKKQKIDNFIDMRNEEEDIIYSRQPSKKMKKCFSESEIRFLSRGTPDDYNDWDIV